MGKIWEKYTWEKCGRKMGKKNENISSGKASMGILKIHEKLAISMGNKTTET